VENNLSVFADGVFQYGGQPVGAGQFSSPWAKAWFVDGTDGNDNNSGLKPTEAKKTIQSAVTAAGRGDIVYVRPLTYTTDASDVNRYTEAVTVPYATADLSVIGVSNTKPGNPNYGAKLQWVTALGTALKVNAPAFHLENMCVRAEAASIGVHLYGVANDNYVAYGGSCGSTLNNVVIRGGTYGVKVENGYATVIANCRFEGGSAQTSSYLLDGSQGPSRRHVVANCTFDSYNGAVIAEAYVRLVGTNTDFLLTRCNFDIMPTDTHWINATGTNLGLISDCYFGVADMTLATGIVKGGLMVSGCYDGKVVLID
jgi:hypothetical protein